MLKPEFATCSVSTSRLQGKVVLIFKVTVFGRKFQNRDVREALRREF
jgi:hypothetical protein